MGINTSEPGITIYELWVTDAPLDNWFEIYSTEQLDPNGWWLAHFGPPAEGYGTSLQKYFVVAPGQPDQSYFHALSFQDSDGDGLTDGMEIAVFKSNPHNPDSVFLRDDDGDGLPDIPNAQANWIVDGDEDFDRDGLSNLKELQMGTDPLVPQNYFLRCEALHSLGIKLCTSSKPAYV